MLDVLEVRKTNVYYVILTQDPTYKERDVFQIVEQAFLKLKMIVVAYILKNVLAIM